MNFKELTDQEREQLFARVSDMATEAKDLALELNDLRMELCTHEYEEVPGFALPQCTKCGHVCRHDRAFRLTRECDDCGRSRRIEIQRG